MKSHVNLDRTELSYILYAGFITALIFFTAVLETSPAYRFLWQFEVLLLTMGYITSRALEKT